MFNFFKKRNNTYIIRVVARNLETNEIETFDLDNIAFNNFAMYADLDWEIISAERI